METNIDRRWLSRWGGCLLLALCVVAVSGCYERKEVDGAAIYSFASWVQITVTLVSLGTLAIGIGLTWLSAPYRFILAFVGLVLTIIVAPGMFCDEVYVDQTRFKARYGFWFSPSDHDVRFADLRQIDFVTYASGRKRSTSRRLDCIDLHGNITVVHAGDLVINAVPEILKIAEQQGIRVESRDER